MTESNEIAPIVDVEAIDEIKRLLENAWAKNTRRSHARQWRAFQEWCEGRRYPWLPASAETVMLYLNDQRKEGLAISTLARAKSVISKAHSVAHKPNPCSDARVALFWQALRRTIGKPPKQVDALGPTDIFRMCERCGENNAGVRDRAILLVGFAGAFRRSELVSLEAADVTFEPDGVRLMLRRSKTDQEGEGREVGIPYSSDERVCPVRCLQRWFRRRGDYEGAVFRRLGVGGEILVEPMSDRAIARLVQRRAKAAGIDPKHVAGHSLRAGFVTTAANAGKNLFLIQKQTGHRSLDVLQKYVRAGTLLTENASVGLLDRHGEDES